MGKTLKIAKVRRCGSREARDIRCRSGLSVAELAGELGVSPTTVWYGKTRGTCRRVIVRSATSKSLSGSNGSEQMTPKSWPNCAGRPSPR